MSNVRHITCIIHAIADSAVENNVRFTLFELDDVVTALRNAEHRISEHIRYRLPEIGGPRP